MLSKPLAFGLLTLGCVTAAAGGAYLAVRHNARDTNPRAATVAAVTAPARPAAAPEPPRAAARPASPAATVRDPTPRAEPVRPRTKPPQAAARTKPPATRTARPDPPAAPPARTLPPLQNSWPADPASDRAGAIPIASGAPAAGAPADAPASPAPIPDAPPAPEFDDVVLPASSVMGLEIQTPLSSERSRIEDRVDARVMRDVMANGRVAIPAGSRVIGSVVQVDRGGRMRERARLGIRFHTLVLADGTHVRIETESIFRGGQSPAGDSARKIGGAAIGGAILGAILGGGKGAVIGGMTGAGGGTAVVMTGDPNPATFAPGSIVTARLASPVTVQVQKR